MTLLKHFAATLSVVVALTACTSAPAAQSASPGAADAIFRQAIETAVHGGAGAAQLEVLERARDAGEVTLDDVKSAVANTFECFEQAGIPYRSDGVATSQGQPVYMYSFSSAAGMSEADSLAIADECQRLESFYVEDLYRTQPVAIEAYESYLETQVRPLLLPCLVSLGVPVSEDTPNQELMLLALDIHTEQAVAAEQAGVGEPEWTCVWDVLMATN